MKKNYKLQNTNYKHNDLPIYSGASPGQVAEDLKPLMEFREEGLSIEEISDLINQRLVPHLMKYDCPLLCAK